MNNILVATFNNDQTAIEGLHKLNALQRQGDIDVYNNVLLRRNLDGTFSYLKDEREPEGWATLGGVILGPLVGALGGPVGVIVGMFAGLALGGMTDVAKYSYDYEFLDSFKNGLPVGTTTIIAEVTEPSDVFVNNALAPLCAVVFRSDIYGEKDRYFQSEVDYLDQQIDETNKEIDASVEADRQKLKAKVAELKAKRDKRVAEIKASIQEDIDSMKADVAAVKSNLKADIDSAKRRRLEARLAKTEQRIEKYEAQEAKLEAEVAKFKTAPAT